MKVKEVLLRRDQLKSYIYALDRSITYCEMNMHDDEMKKNLTDLRQEMHDKYQDLCNELLPIEEMEM